MTPDATTHPTPTPVGGTLGSRNPWQSFGLGLAVIAVVGIVVRVAYIQIVGPHTRVYTDSSWYYLLAKDVRHGLGYIDIGRQFGFGGSPTRRPTAFLPPGYPSFLVVVQTPFGEAVHTARLSGVATDAATVALTGLLGRAVAGRRIGLLAALLVALSPLIIAVEGSLMSETLSVPLVLVALLLAQRARERPTTLLWCALGAAIGAAALTREDSLFLVPCALIPAALLSRDTARHVAPRVFLSLGVTALVLTPWLVRNVIVVHQGAIATHSASMIAGANCALTYHGSALGYWNGGCANFGAVVRMSEARWANMDRKQGTSYARAHWDRWPLVIGARVARVWGLWNPINQARFDHVESRNLIWQELMWPVSLATLALGVAGFRVLARQGREIAMLLAPIAMTTLIAIVSFGNTRLRAPAECTLAIGAAALMAGWRRLNSARLATEGPNQPAPARSAGHAPPSNATFSR